MRKVLSIDNKTEDIPQVLRATCRLKGKPAAFVLRPQDGQVVLAVFGDKEAQVWRSTNGTLPSGTPTAMPRQDALKLVKALSTRQGTPGGASLRGRWKGTASLDSRGLPQIELTRRVGQAVVTVRSADLPCRPYMVTVAVDGTWKGGPSKRQPRQVPASGNQLLAAFELARKEVRTALRTLHGESDRRQAHDSGYAQRKPIKWSGTPRDPLERFDAKPAKKRASRKAATQSGKAASSAKKTASSAKKNASSAKKSTSSAKKSTSSAKKSTSSAKKNATQTASSAKKNASSPKKATSVPKKTASSTKKTTRSSGSHPPATTTTAHDEQLAMLFAEAIRTAVREARPA